MENAAKQTSDRQDAWRWAARLRPQFTIRAMLMVVLFCGVALAPWANSARQQKRAVEAIENAGGGVTYDYEQSSSSVDEDELPGPDWLCRQIGRDYFATVIGAALPDNASDITVQELSRLPRIRALYLIRTNVTDAGLRHLSSSRSLQYLELGETSVGDAGMQQLSGLTNLEWLDLNDTRVTDAGLARLHGLTRLRVLYLGGTQVTDDGLAHLSGLKSLIELSLDNTEVSDAGVSHLSRLTSLETLWLKRTSFTESGLERLEASLPNCKINPLF